MSLSERIAAVLAEHEANRCWWHCAGGTSWTPSQHAAHVADAVVAVLAASHVVVERDQLERFVGLCKDDADECAADEGAHCEEMFYRGQAVAYSVVIDGTMDTYERALTTRPAEAGDV